MDLPCIISVIQALYEKYFSEDNVRCNSIRLDCVAQALDLVFVVDGSGSICDNDPNFQYGTDITCDNWNFILKFMEDFVNDMDVGLSATRVGLVTFASTATLGWNLKTYEYFQK